MLAAPVDIGEAKIAIAERAGDGDLTDRDRAVERRRFAFQSIDGARHRQFLPLNQFLRNLAGFVKCQFHTHGDRGVENAISQGQLAQRRPSAGAAVRIKQRAAFGIQVFADRVGLEQCRAGRRGSG